ncbi:MAG: MBL fold metallo-hydrolase [Limnochordia bacterium]|jgi:hydroxyacylglutathione hydrolase
MHLEDEFGDIVQKARQGKGLSIEEIAPLTNISSDDWRQMEAYKRGPTEEELGRICQALDLAPGPLSAIWQDHYQPDSPPMVQSWGRIHQVTAPDTGSHCYILTQGNYCLIIDPGAPGRAILPHISGQLSAILLTHTHADHVAGLEELLERYPVPVIVGENEDFPGPHRRPIKEGTTLPWGEVKVEIIPSPGHTPGGLAFYLPGALFSGDTIFAGSLGRARGPVAYQQLLDSSRRLTGLPAEVGLFPGHGPLSTIGQELKHNPFIT